MLMERWPGGKADVLGRCYLTAVKKNYVSSLLCNF